jgi:hypothetical protein
MFGELPKLFDREFAIGFFLPATVLIGAIWILLRVFDVTSGAPNLETATTTAIAIGVVWLTAVALLAMNYPILRLLEGYPRFYPLRSKGERVWRSRFRSIAQPSLDLDGKITASQKTGTPPPYIPSTFTDDLRFAVENFPDEEGWVLPTRFGNIFRSIEVYSRVIYGLDAIPALPRLQAVLPDQFKKQLGEAKSLLDFFVNLIFVGIVTTILCLILAFWTRHLTNIWLIVVGIVLWAGSYRASLVAIGQYGVHVKTGFDLYRGELAKQLGLQLPQNALREREMWELVSKLLISRSVRYSDQLDRYRAPLRPESTED